MTFHMLQGNTKISENTWWGWGLWVFRRRQWIAQGWRTRLLRRLWVSRRSLRQCGVSPGNGRHAPRQGARLGGSHAGQGGVFRRRGAATGEASTPLGIARGRMLGHWLVPSHHTFKLVCILLFYDAPRLEIFRVRIRG